MSTNNSTGNHDTNSSTEYIVIDSKKIIRNMMQNPVIGPAPFRDANNIIHIPRGTIESITNRASHITIKQISVDMTYYNINNRNNRFYFQADDDFTAVNPLHRVRYAEVPEGQYNIDELLFVLGDLIWHPTLVPGTGYSTLFHLDGSVAPDILARSSFKIRKTLEKGTRATITIEYPPGGFRIVSDLTKDYPEMRELLGFPQDQITHIFPVAPTETADPIEGKNTYDLSGGTNLYVISEALTQGRMRVYDIADRKPNILAVLPMNNFSFGEKSLFDLNIRIPVDRALTSNGWDFHILDEWGYAPSFNGGGWKMIIEVTRPLELRI